MSHRRTKVIDLSQEDEIGSKKRPLEILSDDDEAPPSRTRVRKVVERSDERGTYLDLIYVDVELPACANKSLKPVEKPVPPSAPSMPTVREPSVQPMKDPETEDIGATNAFLEQVNRQLHAVESIDRDMQMEVVVEAEDGANASAIRVTNDTEPVKPVPPTVAADDPFIDTDMRSIATSATSATSAISATSANTATTATATTTAHPAAPTKVVLIEPQSGVPVGTGIGRDHVYTAGYLGMGGYNGREYWVYHYISDIVAKKWFGVNKYAVVNLCDVYLKRCNVDANHGSDVSNVRAVRGARGDGSMSGSGVSDSTTDGGGNGDSSVGDAGSNIGTVGNTDANASSSTGQRHANNRRTRTSDTPAPFTPPSTLSSTTPSTIPSSGSSDTDTTLPTANYTTTPKKVRRRYTSPVAMERILSGYKALASLSDKELKQRHIDPGAFKALLLAQAKLAAAMTDMLCWKK